MKVSSVDNQGSPTKAAYDSENGVPHDRAASQKRKASVCYNVVTVIYVVVMVSAVCSVVFFWKRVIEYLLVFLKWSRIHPTHAAGLVILIQDLVAIFCVPSLDTYLMIATGFIFKFPMNFVIATAAYNTASWAGFWVARIFLRSWLIERTKNHRILSALSRVTKEKGWLLQFLMTASPVGLPSSVLNAYFGASSISFTGFAFGTLLGCGPTVFFFIYIGSMLNSIHEVVTGQAIHGTSYFVFMSLGMLVFIGALVYIGIETKRMLDTIVEEGQQRSDEIGHGGSQIQNSDSDPSTGITQEETMSLIAASSKQNSGSGMNGHMYGQASRMSNCGVNEANPAATSQTDEFIYAAENEDDEPETMVC